MISTIKSKKSKDHFAGTISSKKKFSSIRVKDSPSKSPPRNKSKRSSNKKGSSHKHSSKKSVVKTSNKSGSKYGIDIKSMSKSTRSRTTNMSTKSWKDEAIEELGSIEIFFDTKVMWFVSKFKVFIIAVGFLMAAYAGYRCTEI